MYIYFLNDKNMTIMRTLVSRYLRGHFGHTIEAFQGSTSLINSFTGTMYSDIFTASY